MQSCPECSGLSAPVPVAAISREDAHSVWWMEDGYLVLHTALMLEPRHPNRRHHGGYLKLRLELPSRNHRGSCCIVKGTSQFRPTAGWTPQSEGFLAVSVGHPAARFAWARSRWLRHPLLRVTSVASSPGWPAQLHTNRESPPRTSLRSRIQAASIEGSKRLFHGPRTVSTAFQGSVVMKGCMAAYCIVCAVDRRTLAYSCSSLQPMSGRGV